ncbi:hypothetical protein [Lientehia hominis]|nr:hypothetical protein [Lientehia hominis]
MWENFWISLEIMGKGMGGIFVAILIIVALVWIMNRLGKEKDK